VSKVGRIEWPARLWEDGYELRGHTIPPLSRAFEDAVPVIIKILRGELPHAVMDLWRDWQDGVHSTGLRRDLHHSVFLTQYRVPLLPSDNSMVLDVCECMTRRLAGRPTDDTTADSVNHYDQHTLVLGPGRLLLQMVALRIYFGRSPGHDEEIWSLWRDGRIRRIWSDYELAMSSMQILRWPLVPGSPVGKSRDLPSQRSRHTHALDEFVPVEVVAFDGQPHHWSAGTAAVGLTHGEVKAATSQKSKARGRPRARKTFANPDNPADAASGGALEVIPATVTVKKRDRMDTEGPGNEGVRRGKRLQEDTVGEEEVIGDEKAAGREDAMETE
jgi:hypothetical protein